MWQTAITLLIVAVVMVYLVRHFFRSWRSGSCACSSCPAAHDQSHAPAGCACREPGSGGDSDCERFDQQ